MKTISDFIDAECELSSPLGIFVGVYELTRGDPCTTGCAYYRGGACPAYRKLFRPILAQMDKPETETVAQQAERLGVSKSEIRRRRRRV